MGLYIGRSTQEGKSNLYRFGKGGGHGRAGTIHARWKHHRSLPDGAENGTNEHRPFAEVWAFPFEVEDSLDLQIAEGLLGKRLRQVFIHCLPYSLFKASNDAVVVEVANAAADEIERLLTVRR